jgi:hypothetical protein
MFTWIGPFVGGKRVGESAAAFSVVAVAANPGHMLLLLDAIGLLVSGGVDCAGLKNSVASGESGGEGSFEWASFPGGTTGVE